MSTVSRGLRGRRRPPAELPALDELAIGRDVTLDVAERPAVAREAQPRIERLGGELAPFQWAAVRYALDARRTFLAGGVTPPLIAAPDEHADDMVPESRKFS